MTAENYIINVSKLNKNFGKLHAVIDVDLRVKKGEVFGFLGPNGSGKTTTIRLLCGLLTPDSGSGECLGFDLLTQSQQIKLHVGYMTQNFSYYGNLTIQENLELMARLHSVEQRKERVKEALERLGLTDSRKKITGELSGGWKQRVALAACLLHHPQLLLLDEPTAGVDPKARREFWDQIHQLSQEGVTTLVSTHYMDEAARCTRLAYIAYGKILVEGSKQEVIDYVGLLTWQITGTGLHRVAQSLKSMSGVMQAVNFGDALHVCGKDELALQTSIHKVIDPQKHRIERIKTNLEDSFVFLVDHDEDN
ncbi:MAG: ABC transporter ATP-binding protein [Gammaproteobacteria bacterium]